MSNKNFRCPESGDEFYYYQHSTSFSKLGEKIYKDKYGRELVHPESGVKLELIEKTPDWNKGCPSVIGSPSGEKKRLVAHLKQRAKDHGNSPEEKHNQAEAAKREMSNIGYETIKNPKKKK